MSVVVSGGRAVKAASSSLSHLREAVADVTRQLEDARWVNLSTDRRAVYGGADMAYGDRLELLDRVRLYRRRSPLAKQAAKLLQHYVLGQGITLRPNNKTQVAKIVDEFWDDPINRVTLTSNQALGEFVDTIFTDGNALILLHPDLETGTLKLGTIDFAYLEDIVCDPDNWRIPLWYKVRRPKGKYDYSQGIYQVDGEDEIVWYRDWRNDLPVGGKNAPRKVEDGLVYHVAIDRRGKYGESEIAVAADWLKAHKEFMQDRATMHRAAASIVWRKKRTGGNANDISTQVQTLQSSLAASLQRGWETNPAPASGSTIVENQNSTMEWIGANPGAANGDEKLIRMMAGVSMGVMNHYFGDEGGARLATATAMELPMLKNYEAWQRFLGDVISDLIDFALTVAHIAGRVGPRDDVSKYADKRKQAEDLAQFGDDEMLDPQVAKRNKASGIGTGGGTNASQMSIGEAYHGLKLTGQAKMRENRTVESDRQLGRVLRRIRTTESQKDKSLFDAELREAEARFREAPEPPAEIEGSTTTVPSFLQVLPTSPAPGVLDITYDVEGAIDWYVDLDFPPIVQKDVNNYMFALSSMYNMMPVTNIESQKLIVGMALNAFGVNDVPEVMDKLFAKLSFLPSNVQLEKEMAQNPEMLVGGMGAPGAGAGPLPGGGAPIGASPEAAPALGMTESQLPAKTQRVLQTLRETAEAIAAATNTNGNGTHR